MEDKILIISVEEIEEPKGGFLSRGWYAGRQFFKGKFGVRGMLINGRTTTVKRIKEDQILKIIAKLIKAKDVYIEK